jgi:hypothetical protein
MSESADEWAYQKYLKDTITVDRCVNTAIFAAANLADTFDPQPGSPSENKCFFDECSWRLRTAVERAECAIVEAYTSTPLPSLESTLKAPASDNQQKDLSRVPITSTDKPANHDTKWSGFYGSQERLSSLVVSLDEAKARHKFLLLLYQGQNSHCEGKVHSPGVVDSVVRVSEVPKHRKEHSPRIPTTTASSGTTTDTTKDIPSAWKKDTSAPSRIPEPPAECKNNWILPPYLRPRQPKVQHAAHADKHADGFKDKTEQEKENNYTIARGALEGASTEEEKATQGNTTKAASRAGPGLRCSHYFNPQLRYKAAVLIQRWWFCSHKRRRRRRGVKKKRKAPRATLGIDASPLRHPPPTIRGGEHCEKTTSDVIDRMIGKTAVGGGGGVGGV